MLNHQQHLESHNNNQASAAAPIKSDQTVPLGKIIPRPPPQSTRPARGSSHRKIRLPPKQQQQQPIINVEMNVNHDTNSGIKQPSKILPISNIVSSTSAMTNTYEFTSSNVEDDVHNHSSKTIIDLIQPNRVKLAMHFHNSKPSKTGIFEKDSLSADDSVTSFIKSIVKCFIY